MKGNTEMPALKKTAVSPIYLAARGSEARQALNEQRDCAVIAITVVTGCSYSEAHAVLAAQGRRSGRGTFTVQTIKALEAMGYTVRRWTSKEVADMLQSYPKKGIAGITTHHPRRFPKQWAGKPPLLFSQNNHISGFRDGELHDWAVNRSKQVLAVYEVTK